MFNEREFFQIVPDGNYSVTEIQRTNNRIIYLVNNGQNKGMKYFHFFYADLPPAVIDKITIIGGKCTDV